jgi:hypothetical protein
VSPQPSPQFTERDAAYHAYLALRALASMRSALVGAKPEAGRRWSGDLFAHATRGDLVAGTVSARTMAADALLVVAAYADKLDLDATKITHLQLLVEASAEDIGEDLAAAFMFLDAHNALESRPPGGGAA